MPWTPCYPSLSPKGRPCSVNAMHCQLPASSPAHAAGAHKALAYLLCPQARLERMRSTWSFCCKSRAASASRSAASARSYAASRLACAVCSWTSAAVRRRSRLQTLASGVLPLGQGTLMEPEAVDRVLQLARKGSVDSGAGTSQQLEAVDQDLYVAKDSTPEWGGLCQQLTASPHEALHLIWLFLDL